MAKRSKKSKSTASARTQSSGANVGYEAQLWQMADALRGSMDAAEYKHVVLGLIFLKYISDAFEEQHARLVADKKSGADPEDPDEYRAHSIFWVPPEARWAHLKAQARQPTIGQLVDDAMAGIERDNPALKGVLPKDYARPALDKTAPRPAHRPGQQHPGRRRGEPRQGRARPRLRVLPLAVRERRGQEGRRVLHAALRGQAARRDAGALPRPRLRPVLRFGGHVRAVGRVHPRAREGQRNGGKAKADISIYGQESNYTTWRLAKMNLAIRGIDGQIAHGDTFHNDRHPDLKADFILANPPFNDQRLGRRPSARRQALEGTACRPPATPTSPGCSTSSITSRPRASPASCSPTARCRPISPARARSARTWSRPTSWTAWSRCPGQLFYSTQIPACLWFLARDRKNGKFRDRRGHVLFIDARKLGRMVDRTHRELTDEEVARIANTYHAWRGEKEAGEYADVPGFCKSATLEEVRKHGHVLTPGRYVGAEAQEDDGEPFEEKMKRLTATLREQQAEAAKLDAAIAANLKELGYGG